MLFDHKKFRSMYDRIPDDYPDAYTINRAKILQEQRLPLTSLSSSGSTSHHFRLFEFFSENREVESLIKKLFRKNELAEDDEEEEENMNRMRLEYEDPVLWDAHIDVIKRRMSKLRGDSQPSPWCHL